MTSPHQSLGKIGRMMSKLHIEDPQPEEDPDLLPETKRAVFQHFEKRRSEPNPRAVLRIQQRTESSHSQCSQASASSTLERPPKIQLSEPIDVDVYYPKTPSRAMVSRSQDAVADAQWSSRASTSGCSGPPVRSSPPRRNSTFSGATKRGSMTIEAAMVKKVDLDETYNVYKQLHAPPATSRSAEKAISQLGTGRFGYIKLAEHKESKQKIAIKFFPRPQTKQSDFIREYNYSFFLSPHYNIVDTYEGVMQTTDETAYFFVQEFCPSASLREAVESSTHGIGEAATRAVMSGVLAAIEYMHLEGLVHRNLKAENILIFDPKNYSKVKVTDFGLTRKVDSTVKYLEYVNQYHAPELCETVANEMLTVAASIDIWALGVIIYYALKGKFPWQKASIMCKPYWEWEQWLKRKNPALPKKMTAFTEKGIKLFKKSFAAKPKDRWTAKEMRKWVTKEKLMNKVKADSPDDLYYPESDADKTEARSSGETPREGTKKQRSTLHQWINSTLNTMAEISEQVVSAHD